MGIFEGDAYKCILGMDLLVPFRAVVDGAARTVSMIDKDGKKFTLRLLTKDELRSSQLLSSFRRG